MRGALRLKHLHCADVTQEALRVRFAALVLRRVAANLPRSKCRKPGVLRTDIVA